MKTLVGLFQQKMEFMKETKNRELNLEERKQLDQNNLETAKLEAQITSDKDKLAWDKDKAILGFKNGLDLQTLQNQGLIDVEKLRGANQKDVAEITAAATKYGHDVTALGAILGHTKTVDKYGENGQLIATERPAAGAGGIAQRMANNVGLGPQPVSQVDLDNASINIMELQRKNPQSAVAELQRMRTTNPDLYDAIKQTPPPSSTPAPGSMVAAATSPAIATRPAPVAEAPVPPAPAASPVIQPRQAEYRPTPRTAFGERAPRILAPLNSTEEIAANRATQDSINAAALATEANRPRLAAPPTIAQSFGLGPRAPVSIGGMNTGVIPQTVVADARNKRKLNTAQF